MIFKTKRSMALLMGLLVAAAPLAAYAQRGPARPSAAPAVPAVPVVRVVRVVRAVPVVPAGGQVVAMVVREVGRVARAGAVAPIAARMAVCGGGVTGMMAAVFLWITGAVIVACMRRHRVIAGLTTAAAFCWRLWPRVLFPMSLRGVSIR